MKLLFDQNLSPRLVNRLADLFPDSIHVQTAGLDASSDIDVWQYARTNDFLIVSRDVDFSERSILFGFPPKVIWVRRGNCSTSDIEALLRNNFDAIEKLEMDQVIGLLTLF